MESNHSNNNTPEFSSLTEIMDRFNQVPYSQFKQELSAWFNRGLEERNVSRLNIPEEEALLLKQIEYVVNHIYDQAEMGQLIEDLKSLKK